MKPRYVLCPGGCISNKDGQLREYNAPQLLALYNVPEGSDVIVKDDHHRHKFTPTDRDVYLRPKADGDYTLPKVPG